MTNQQLFVLGFTFFVGMAAGFYIYVTSFAPQYGASTAQGTDVELTIIGDQVGGCQMVGICPSFRLESDRRFDYIPAHQLTDAEPAPVSGRVSTEAYRQLQTILADTDMASLQVEADVCQAAFDGIDYQYRIVYDDTEYELNSCGTEFYGTRLYNQLLVVWGEMLKAEAAATN